VQGRDLIQNEYLHKNEYAATKRLFQEFTHCLPLSFASMHPFPAAEDF
jgi:hypothetical protein